LTGVGVEQRPGRDRERRNWADSGHCRSRRESAATQIAVIYRIGDATGRLQAAIVDTSSIWVTCVINITDGFSLTWNIRSRQVMPLAGKAF
jgi:hypothetical protein